MTCALRPTVVPNVAMLQRIARPMLSASQRKIINSNCATPVSAAAATKINMIARRFSARRSIGGAATAAAAAGASSSPNGAPHRPHTGRNPPGAPRAFSRLRAPQFRQVTSLLTDAIIIAAAISAHSP